MSSETAIKFPDDLDMRSPATFNAKQVAKLGSVSVPKLDLSLIAHGERVRLHPNSVRMLLSDDVTPQEKERIKGAGGWIKILEPLLTKHVSETLVHDITKICATINLIPGQFLLRQGLPAKSIFVVVSGYFRLISLGVPGVEPLDSSRAKSARHSFTARQEVRTFGALIDPPKSSRPSASFASEVPVYRVASVGPGQLIGEECFSAQRIIQFSVMSDTYATVISVPIDSLLPLLTKERHSALSAMCLNTLTHRAQRAAAGGSWYQSRKTEIQSFKRAVPPMAMIGTQIQNLSSAARSGNPSTTEDASLAISSVPAYPIATSAEGQKIAHEQLMVCIVSATANSSRSPQTILSDSVANFSTGNADSDGAHLAVELESLTSRGNTSSNPAALEIKGEGTKVRPWPCHHRTTARQSTNEKTGYFVHSSQSHAGHSAALLLSRNLIIKKMYEQLQEAEQNKKLRLQPKQGDQLSLRNALNMLGRRANVVAKKTLLSPKNEESSQFQQKGSVIDTHLKTLFINQQPPPRIEIVAQAKVTPMSSASHSANGRTIQSQESARQSRPYNSNFSFLFEGREVGSLHQEIVSRGQASGGHVPDQSVGWTSNQLPESIDQLSSKPTSNLLTIQTPHPPASQSSENASAGVAAKRKKFVALSTAEFNPTKDAELKDHCLPARPQSHKTSAPNQKLFETHVASSPKKVQPSTIALSAAKTEPKVTAPVSDRAHPTDLFIGSKDAREARQLELNAANKKPARVKGTHAVGFHMDQVGPPLDRDLGRDEVSFSMSPWKSGA